jgi:uncharacterized protein YcbK (DUF882 family)
VDIRRLYGLRARCATAATLTRRRFLALAAWGAATAVLPRRALAASFSAPDETRRLSFRNLHTDERLTATYWENGSYVPSALEQIDLIMRDHRTGDVRPMAPGLIELVHALASRLETAEPVQIVSGYRSAATNAMLHAGDPAHVAEHSLHLSGEALDLCFESRSLDAVRNAALALAGGGVGYYPRTGFVHVDVGAVRSW